MVHARIVAGRRISLDECKNAIIKLANKNNEDISKCLIGAKLLLGDEAVSDYETKFKAYVEYLKTKVDDSAKELRDVLKIAKTIHLYVFRMNIWCTYKLDGEKKTKTFIGNVVEDSNLNIDEDRISDYEIKAEVGDKITRSTTIAALSKIVGIAYDEMTSFLRSIVNQTGIETKYDELNKKNEEFINDVIAHIPKMADDILLFIKEHELTTLKVSNFEVTIAVIDDDGKESSVCKLYPITESVEVKDDELKVGDVEIDNKN